IAGKTVVLDFRPYSVVGIAPRDFRGPDESLFPVDVWIPVSAASPQEKSWFVNRGNRTVTVTACLHPGVSLAQADLALSNIATRLTQEYPATNKGKTVVLRPAAPDKGL